MDKLQWIQNKMRERDQLLRQCNIWRSFGKKIVFTNGCFDILHYGHLHLVAAAANLGNVLVVGINSDASVKRLKGEDRPINHEQERMFQVASLLCTDAVCLFEEDTPEELIKTIRPDVLVKGGDYTIENIVGADFVQSYGGTVSIIPFVEGYSTSATIASIKKL